MDSLNNTLILDLSAPVAPGSVPAGAVQATETFGNIWETTAGAFAGGAQISLPVANTGQLGPGNATTSSVGPTDWISGAAGEPVEPWTGVPIS